MSSSFAGLKIEGELIPPNQFRNQRPAEELIPLIEALLAEPEIDSFGWEQYTPYHSDGDELVFGVGTFWAKTVRCAQNDDDHWSYQFSTSDTNGHKTLGHVHEKGSWVVNGPGPRKWVTEPPVYRPPSREVYPADEAERLWRLCYKTSKAINSGHFNRVLLDKFGDHAAVTMRGGVFHIEQYDHH